MNPIYTYRPFIYRERTDINEYLEESPVWEELHKMYIELIKTGCRVKLSPLELFNEVHYLCVRLLLDNCPKEFFYNDCLPRVSSTMGRYTTGLCFSMVYAVLNTLSNPPEHIPGFLGLLWRRYHARIDQYSFFFEKFAGAPLDLTPCPERPDCIEQDVAWWEEATGDFHRSRIREIVNLWPTLEEKLEIALIIEEQFKQAEKKDQEKEEKNDRGKNHTIAEARPGFFFFFFNNNRVEKADLRFFKELRHEIIASALEQASAAPAPADKACPAPKETDATEQLLKENEALKMQLNSLQEQLKHESSATAPTLADFIAYTEELPAEQNAHAQTIKAMLLDLFNGQITEDEKERIRKLGRKPQAGTNFNFNAPLNDIHNNDYVKAGIQ